MYVVKKQLSYNNNNNNKKPLDETRDTWLLSVLSLKTEENKLDIV